VYPQAAALGVKAFMKFEKQEFEDTAHYIPFYLKDFVAKKAKVLF
jgi:hypothetical protein